MFRLGAGSHIVFKGSAFEPGKDARAGNLLKYFFERTQL